MKLLLLASLVFQLFLAISVPQSLKKTTFISALDSYNSTDLLFSESPSNEGDSEPEEDQSLYASDSILSSEAHSLASSNDPKPTQCSFFHKKEAENILFCSDSSPPYLFI